MQRLLIVWFVMLLVAAACSSGGDEEETAITTAPTSTTAPPSTTATSTTIEPPAATIDSGESPGPEGIGDSLYPTMGNGGYDVQSYSLDLTIDVDDNTLEGFATIDSVANQDLTSFNLDFSGLQIKSLTVNGTVAEHIRVDDELVIAPVEGITSGEEFRTVVAYSGTPEPVNDPGVPFTSIGWLNQSGVVFIVSEPSGAKTFFPSNNHPTDKATYQIRITADTELTSAATGVLLETIENGDGTSTTVWQMDDPMTTYGAAIYVGDFERRESVNVDGVLIRNYFPPDRADDLEVAFELTGDMIAFYSELFGAPYPFDAYGSIVLPFPTGFALENQSLSVHGADTTDIYTIAHEIAHQWAGNAVTVADWQDVWMNEGFATYLPLLYFEARDLDSGLDADAMYFLLEGGAYDGAAEVDIRDLFGASVYFRGGLGLHALRVEVGDDVFRQILRTYYERFQGGHVTTGQFLDLVSELGGPAARDAIDPWLFGRDLPLFPGAVGG